MSERAAWYGVPPEIYNIEQTPDRSGSKRRRAYSTVLFSKKLLVYDRSILGSRVGTMATQITFSGTVEHNDDAEFPFVAVVVADGQVLARYPVRTGAAGRAKLDEAFAMLKAQAATQTDAARYEELSGIIAWLDAMPHTETAAAMAAQRERAVAEQMEITKRRLETMLTGTRAH